VKLIVAAVGRLKAGPLRELQDEYLKRLAAAASLVEVEERRKLPDLRRREAELLLGAVPSGMRVVALDERGRSLTSPDFARRLGDLGEAAFLLGGADGLDESVRTRADVVLALGAMTWPHLLARVMLLEQLYRATTILAGHPYHRG
jgi:23S rRNA (pseudouridine1915-N3)-methyltransferase